MDDDDLCVGGVTANRPKQEMKDMIGMFVNLVPYRMKMEAKNSFEYLIRKIQQLSSDFLEHSCLPYQHIINSQDQQNHQVLPSTLFQYESLVSSVTAKNNIESSTIKGNYVLAVYFDRDRSHECFLDCSIDTFKSQTNVDLLANRFQHMLKQLFSSSSSSVIHEPIYKLSIVLPTEQEFIHQMNNTDISTSYSWPNTVHECFVQQAQLYPQKLALELDGQSLTYSELLYSVYCLTNYLTDKIQPNEIICQCVERSFEMIIGMLAILSSGAVYCPLSPLDPPERLKTLIEDTSAKTLLIHSFTWQTILMTYTSCNLIITDSFIMFNHINYNNDHRITKPISVTSDNIAYIIFTSGTTGIPKAVVISHSHLLLYLQSSVEVDALRTTDRAIQLSSCTWDVHIHEVVGTLLVGGTVILLRSEQGNRNMDYLSQIIKIHQATYICIVPTLQILLFDIVQAQKAVQRPNTLRLIWSVGGPISCRFIARILPMLPIGCQYINFSGATEVRSEYRIRIHYGPAELTINCINHPIDLNKNQIDIPIGQPFPNYQFLILDMFLQTGGIGQEGELGVGVFAGYLDRDDLTAQVMININEQVFYKTGDLVRMDSNGFIHYVGRRDFQVKLRGQRIELQEIVQCLLMLTSITTCVVIKWDDNHLIAYVQSDTINVEQLRHHCQSNLPSHMVPSIFVIL
ncbi:unnamed protein product [Adineta steineri]|uniref:AMP-dependent synthetase/ligase domain-containing protein n=1 Tax=Adineta steineri TaxID=433720 RepID=A0A815J0B7_9BILA|nr:unnamed protein product [Adineta steineri]CAF1375843.1 unnamed protein product [Adineta steineri]